MLEASAASDWYAARDPKVAEEFVYEESVEAVTVLAVAHEKRKPTYWREP